METITIVVHAEHHVSLRGLESEPTCPRSSVPHDIRQRLAGDAVERGLDCGRQGREIGVELDLDPQWRELLGMGVQRLSEAEIVESGGPQVAHDPTYVCDGGLRLVTRPFQQLDDVGAGTVAR